VTRIDFYASERCRLHVDILDVDVRAPLADGHGMLTTLPGCRGLPAFGVVLVTGSVTILPMPPLLSWCWSARQGDDIADVSTASARSANWRSSATPVYPADQRMYLGWPRLPILRAGHVSEPKTSSLHQGNQLRLRSSFSAICPRGCCRSCYRSLVAIGEFASTPGARPARAARFDSSQRM